MKKNCFSSEAKSVLIWTAMIDLYWPYVFVLKGFKMNAVNFTVMFRISNPQ